MGEEAAQALVLMDRMLKLKEQGLQGEQITRHFIKSRLALIKERSRTAFEFDGKHDPNREDPYPLDFKVMKERMYKIFSNAIVVSYSHLLPVVPYNAFNPPPPKPPTRNQSGTEPNKDIPEVEAQAASPPKKDASADPGSSSPVKVQGRTCSRPEIITGPMTGDEEEVLRIQSAEDSRPPILVKWWDDDMQPQGIVVNKQKEDEKVCLLKKALGQATRIVNRIHLRNEAKTATLERLVPHLGTLEATRNQLHEAKELARKTEHDLRDRIAELQDSNFELSGSSKVQAAKISELEKWIQALENDKTELARQRDSALKDVEDCKIKSKAQFDVLVNKIKRLEGLGMKSPTLLPHSSKPCSSITMLRIAPDTYFKNIKEAGSMGASLALAMTKSLYPKIDIDAIDGFVDGTSEEAALDLINDA
uniref:OSIGBa0110B10.5 protein n=1 Tax=Oryza sativa TaxID=4530 RepID=Q01KQ3_ORYSA|nr:OSIGBa0110B10.5 [Oryza sativa]